MVIQDFSDTIMISPIDKGDTNLNTKEMPPYEPEYGQKNAAAV
jgi:hypothetical protein